MKQLLTAVAFWPLSLSAQQIVAFSAEQVANKVLLSFTFSIGSTCPDTQIQRAGESLQFTTIGHIPGVCGSNDAEVTYFFTDSFPDLGTVNNYRISLAGQAFSDTESIAVIPVLEFGLLLFPNPVSDMLRISWPQPTSAPITVLIVEMNGRVVFEEEGTGGFHVTVSVRSLPPGTYRVRVLSADVNYVGSFIKL